MKEATKAAKVASDNGTGKGLRVDFEEISGIPKLKFSGVWSIRDLLKVRRILGKEFYHHRRELIKAGAAINPREV